MKLLWTFSVLPALAAAAGYNPSTTFPGQSTQNGSFINPDNGITSPSDYAYNKVYEVGSQLNISWDASFSPVDLLLCAPGLNGEFAYNKLQHNTSESSYNWAVSNNPVTGTGLVADNLFFMLVNWQGDDGSTYFTSHFFNISNSSTTSATTTLANPSATLAPTATSAFPAASSTAAAGSNGDASAGSDQSTNNSSKGVSGGAAAGIVIGVLAAVGIGAAAVWRFFWLPRRRRAAGGIIGIAGRGDGRGPGAGPMAELENQGGYVAPAGAAGAAEAIAAEYKNDMSGSNLSTWSKSPSTILVSSPQHQHEAQHQDQQLQQPQKQYIYEVAASPVTVQHPMGAPGELPA